MESRLQDEYFMMECIQLARRGVGTVSPNPLVGACIVKRGSIIGKGYHERFGGAHAEVRALQRVRGSLEGATLYVNLEPCCYFGKTPPCTDLIVSRGIRRVVVGMVDPNPLVRGGGIRTLRVAGIDVDVGILRNECKKLNEFYVKTMATGLPFVALKIAQTLDGKISMRGEKARWITSRESRVRVHQLRAQYDAVLIGARTALLDNPRLTVRLSEGRSPKRILLDGNLTTPLTARLFSDSLRRGTIVFTRADEDGRLARKRAVLRARGVRVVEAPSNGAGTINLRAVLKFLAKNGINSVLVEGGQQVFTAFLAERLVDKAYFFIAPKVFGCGGLAAFGETLGTGITFKPRTTCIEQIGPDLLVESYLK
jgi:diaminohydroxyphosphoribosylaminopyrimidine deaminase/5-amino-6-(5-phosphoribosylamino)uracil reductase